MSKRLRLAHTGRSMSTLLRQMSYRAWLFTVTVTLVCTSKECAHKTMLHGSAFAAAICRQHHTAKMSFDFFRSRHVPPARELDLGIGVVGLRQHCCAHLDPLEIHGLHPDGLVHLECVTCGPPKSLCGSSREGSLPCLPDQQHAIKDSASARAAAPAAVAAVVVALALALAGRCGTMRVVFSLLCLACLAPALRPAPFFGTFISSSPQPHSELTFKVLHLFFVQSRRHLDRRQEALQLLFSLSVVTFTNAPDHLLVTSCLRRGSGPFVLTACLFSALLFLSLHVTPLRTLLESCTVLPPRTPLLSPSVFHRSSRTSGSLHNALSERTSRHHKHCRSATPSSGPSCGSSCLPLPASASSICSPPLNSPVHRVHLLSLLLPFFLDHLLTLPHWHPFCFNLLSSLSSSSFSPSSRSSSSDTACLAGCCSVAASFC